MNFCSKLRTKLARIINAILCTAFIFTCFPNLLAGLSSHYIFLAESVPFDGLKENQSKIGKKIIEAPTEEQLESYRSAKNVRIMVRKSYSVDLKTLDIPFEDAIRYLLEYTDLEYTESLEEEEILTISVLSYARAIAANYQSGKRYYTGAELWGSIFFEMDGAVPFTIEYRGKTLPPNAMVATTKEGIERIKKYELPIGAPFEKTLDAPGSIIPTMIHMLSRIYGTALLHPLLGDKRDSIHLSAIRELGKFDDLQTIRLLTARLQKGEPEIQAAAAEALGKIGSDEVIQSLAEALSSTESRVRFNAAKSLWYIGNVQAVETLISHIEDKNIGTSIRTALINIDSSDVEALILTLIKLVEERDGHQRETALALLNKEIARHIKFLGEDFKTQKAASKILVLIGQSAVDPLIQAMSNQSPSRQNRRILGQIPSVLVKIGSAAVDPLIKILDDANSPLRNQAVKILGEIKDPRAVEPLIAVVEDPHFEDKGAAVKALGKMGDRRAVLPLLRLLKDPNSPYRDSAGWALARIGDPIAVEPLIDALKDKNGKPSQSIVDALGLLNDPRAIGPLIEIFNDPYLYRLPVYQKACSILTKLTGEDFRQNPSEWQKWWKKNKKKYIRKDNQF